MPSIKSTTRSIQVDIEYCLQVKPPLPPTLYTYNAYAAVIKPSTLKYLKGIFPCVIWDNVIYLYIYMPFYVYTRNGIENSIGLLLWHLIAFTAEFSSRPIAAYCTARICKFKKKSEMNKKNENFHQVKYFHKLNEKNYTSVLSQQKKKKRHKKKLVIIYKFE